MLQFISILNQKFRAKSILKLREIQTGKNIADVRRWRNSNHNKSLGFVPTMGALHDGHITLVNRAKSESDFVAVSLFVNPTQFSPNEDLDKYPRTLEKDMDLLTKAGVDFVFIPSLDVMYTDSPLCVVEPAAFSHISEGKARPDFFRGVATVVCKLFNIINPTVAYFGQKDISQCILIKALERDFHFPIQIKVCETVRESDGLAMSSRNVYLTASERIAAPILYRALTTAKASCEKAIREGTTLQHKQIVDIVNDILRQEPVVTKVEYVSVASAEDMKEIKEVGGGESASKGAVISSAIRVGNVRLIDNVLVGSAVNFILHNE